MTAWAWTHSFLCEPMGQIVLCFFIEASSKRPFMSFPRKVNFFHLISYFMEIKRSRRSHVIWYYGFLGYDIAWADYTMSIQKTTIARIVTSKKPQILCDLLTCAQHMKGRQTEAHAESYISSEFGTFIPSELYCCKFYARLKMRLSTS